MLMDILMEALMSMDDESFDYVLESCDAEELEIITDAMEARFEDGPTKVSKDEAKRRIYTNLGSNHREEMKTNDDKFNDAARKIMYKEYANDKKILRKIGRDTSKSIATELDANVPKPKSRLLQPKYYAEDRPTALRNLRDNASRVENGKKIPGLSWARTHKVPGWTNNATGNTSTFNANRLRRSDADGPSAHDNYDRGANLAETYFKYKDASKKK